MIPLLKTLATIISMSRAFTFGAQFPRVFRALRLVFRSLGFFFKYAGAAVFASCLNLRFFHDQKADSRYRYDSSLYVGPPYSKQATRTHRNDTIRLRRLYTARSLVISSRFIPSENWLFIDSQRENLLAGRIYALV